jgi:hypothetical protein
MTGLLLTVAALPPPFILTWEVPGTDTVVLSQALRGGTALALIGPPGTGDGGAGITDHGELDGLDEDGHPQYFNQARGDARYALAGAPASAVSAHEAAGDPHPQYTTGAEAVAAAASAVATHAAAGDPHPQYTTTAEADAAAASAVATHAAAGDPHPQYTTTAEAEAAAASAVATHAAAGDPHPQYTTAAEAAAAAPVQTVAGRSGNVVLAKGDVGLANVDNTADAAKPVSSATQTALDGKANTSHTHVAAQISDSTATGRSVLTAADGAAARSAIGAAGLGSFNLTLAAPDNPPADTVTLFRRPVAGRQLPAFVGPSGLDSALQPLLARNAVAMWNAVGGNSTVTVIGGGALTASGTGTVSAVATTNRHTMMRRFDYLVTVAATTAIAGWRAVAANWFRGTGAGNGGFFHVTRWGPATGVATATTRCFVGMAGGVAAPTDVNPSTLLNIIGMGWDSGDAEISVMHNSGSGAATKVPLGASFPRPTADRTEMYEIAVFCPPAAANAFWQVTNLVTGATATGEITTNLPAAAALMAPRGWMSVGGTSAIIGIALCSVYIETDF